MFGLSSLATQLIGAAAIALTMFSAGAYSGYRWELGTYEAKVAADAEANTLAAQTGAAVQKAQDTVAEAGAIADAGAQDHILFVSQTITREIDHYVTDTAHCITFGLVRVLNGAAFNQDPATLAIAPGEPDDACAPISWRAFAGELTDDYRAGNQNAKQLNDLIQNVTDLHTAAVAQEAPKQ